MRAQIGIVVNRLVLGFVFAFVYQMFVGAATSLLSLPLTGNIQDLIWGIQQADSGQGLWVIAWWILSTVIITMIAILIVKNKRYLSPYKQEKNINIPARITPLTVIIVGAMISFVFFLIDLLIGSVVTAGDATDVHAIYQSAVAGDLGPLGISLLFSMIAGFAIVGIVSRTSGVAQIAQNTGFINMMDLSKILRKGHADVMTSSETIGLQPGELVHVGAKLVDKVDIVQIKFDKDNFSRNTIESVEECFADDGRSGVTWTNIVGLHDADVIKKVGDHYALHSLVQSDIMNTELRPRIDDHGNCLYMILKLPHILSNNRLFMEQVSLVVGKDYVVSFQETNDDVFDNIRERLEKNLGRIRESTSDYLAYALADAIIDYYYVILEKIGIQSEQLEEELMTNPNPQTLQTIHSLKREMVTLRKSIWPLREVIDGFGRMESEIVRESTRRYLRDVYNHTVQVMDNIEGLRDMVGGMLDTYLSSVSNKMNEVMKTLTIIASIFIPITFIAGIYGTNFQHIPELAWDGSYFVMLSGMLVIVVVMMVWFKKRSWV